MLETALTNAFSSNNLSFVEDLQKPCGNPATGLPQPSWSHWCDEANLRMLEPDLKTLARTTGPERA